MKIKRQRKRLYSLLSIFFSLVILLGGFFHLINGKIIMAAPTAPDGYTPFSSTNTPGINIISNGKNTSTGLTLELPGEYGTFFQLSDVTSYEVTGAAAQRDYSGATDGTKIYSFNKSSVGATITVKNAAVYKGEYIDLKMTIDDITLSSSASASHNPNFYFIGVKDGDREISENLPISGIPNLGAAYLFLGATNTGQYNPNGVYSLYEIGDSISYTYTFLESDTQKEIDFQGIWNFSNINGLKAASIADDAADFSSYYVQDIVTLGVKENTRADVSTVGWKEFYGESSQVNRTKSKMSKTLDARSLQMNMQKRAVTAGSTDPGPMGILYDSASIARVAPATPIVYGETNSSNHTDVNNYLKLKYSILQTIPDNTWDTASGVNNRDSAFRIETSVPSYYSFTTENVSNIKIIDYATNEDLSGLFSVAVDPSDSSKLIITAKDLTEKDNSDAFNGRSYYISVEASKNDTFLFDAAAYGYDPSTCYMTNFDMGTSTTTYYTYSDIVNKALTSSSSVGTTDPYDKEEDERTVSNILYNGIPSAEARKDSSDPANPDQPLTFDKGTDFSNPTDFSMEGIKEKLITNVKTDTGNDAVGAPDEIVSITIVSSPDTSVTGSGTVVVRLTTAAGVTTDVDVPVIIAETQGKVIVEFVSDEEPEQTLNGAIELSGAIGSEIVIGDNTDVQTAIADIEAEGWTIALTSPNDKTVTVTETPITRKYIFTRADADLKVNFVDSGGNPIAESIKIGGKATGLVDLLSADHDVKATIDSLYDDGWDVDETKRPSPEAAYPIPVGGGEISYVFTRAQAKILVKFVYSDGATPPADISLRKDVGVSTNIGSDAEVASIITDITGQGYSVQRPANETLVVPREGATLTYTFTLIPVDAVLNVEFINREDGSILHDKEIIKAEVNDVINLRDESSYKIVEILKKLEADGYELKKSPDNESGYTISSAEETVTYFFEGTVQIITAPATIDFGTIAFTGRDIEVKEATITGDPLEVRDTRSTTAAKTWKLKAKVTQAMTRVGDTNILTDALHYQNGTDNLTLTAAEQVIYTKDSGGTQNISANWSKDGDGVKLSVKGMDAEKSGDYVGEITWVLEAS